ncbi:MAG TPA: glucoamylase family protein, partial [bacterium]|nr:glucoamylase family protein [bacterium]
PGGYRAYGAKPGEGFHDGTIAPYAAIASVVFTPAESFRTVRHFYENYYDQLYGHFGFRGAFNLDKNWWAQEYLGIDQGITVLMLENFINDGAVWENFMKIPAVQRWIDLCELRPRAGTSIPSS